MRRIANRPATLLAAAIVLALGAGTSFAAPDAKLLAAATQAQPAVTRA